MDPVIEAAQVLTRIFEALARRSGKTLSKRSREEIYHACELLATGGLGDLLDDLPEPQPRPRTAYSTVNFETVPPEVERWRERREQ